MPSRFVVNTSGLLKASDVESGRIAEQAVIVLCKIACDLGTDDGCQFFLETRAGRPGNEIWQVEVKRIGAQRLH